jgi:transposase-like protein
MFLSQGDENMAADLTNPIFQDEEKARAHFEAIRWPNGPVCPHCGVIDEATKVNGKSHRKGMYQCNACRKPFSVTVGGIMESSHIKLHKWALAFHLMASSKKGFSAHQLHRNLGITYRSAWFMAHRIREAMRDSDTSMLGGVGKIVEVDETYYGDKDEAPTHRTSGARFLKRKPHAKRAIVTLVERGGKTRSFHFKDNPTKEAIEKVLVENIAPETIIATDESRLYREVGEKFAFHGTVKHRSNQWTKGVIHTNNVESFYGVFKRGMRGTYQHCGERHLHRYVAEFDFRQNNRTALGVEDLERARKAVKGAAGKRLMYQGASGARKA